MGKRKYRFHPFRKQRSKSPTPEIATRYSSRLPRFVFQFARAAADHFLRKAGVATVARRFFPSAKRRSPVFTWQFRFRMTKKLKKRRGPALTILTYKKSVEKPIQIVCTIE